MTPSRPALHVQVRHLSAVQIAIDVIVMSVVSTLAMFALMLASFQNFNAIMFEASLNYGVRDVTSEQKAANLTFTEVPGLWVERIPRTGSHADEEVSVQARVWVHPVHARARVGDLLHRTLVEGEVSDDGAVLDFASAQKLGVAPGQTLSLQTDDFEECQVTISGVLMPVAEVGGSVNQGLVLMPADACQTGFMTRAEEASRYVQFDPERPGPSAQTWLQRVLSTLLAATDFNVSGLLPPILLIGLGLATLVGLRAATRIRRQLEPVSQLLFDLGCRAAVVRRAHLLVTSFMTVMAASSAAWAAREALWRWATFYIQPAHAITIAVVFSGATIGIHLASHRRASREESRRPAPKSPPAPFVAQPGGMP